jgi:hypothetical protein
MYTHSLHITCGSTWPNSIVYCNFDIKKEKKIYAHDTRGYVYIVGVYILGILFV